jgi:hypothetical protein
MEHWWKDANRVKPKYLEKNLSQYHFVHKNLIPRPIYTAHGNKPGFRDEKPSTDRLRNGTA